MYIGLVLFAKIMSQQIFTSLVRSMREKDIYGRHTMISSVANQYSFGCPVVEPSYETCPFLCIEGVSSGLCEHLGVCEHSNIFASVSSFIRSSVRSYDLLGICMIMSKQASSSNSSRHQFLQAF